MSKNSIFLLLFLIILLPLACSKGEKTKAEIEKSMEEKIKLPDKLKIINDLKKIRDAIVIYRILNEINPSSLEELNLELYYQGEYIYDSNKGTVKSKSYPNT